MLRDAVMGLGAAAVTALVEILLLGANKIEIASPLSFAPEVWHTPIWSLVALPIIVGVIVFAGFLKD